MLEDLRYLKWAHRLYPEVSRYDLASSGTPEAPASSLGEVDLSNWQHWHLFRERIAERYGIAQPEELLPTLGVSQALWLVCAALLEPGDEVIVEIPTYEPLALVPAGLGAELRRVERRIERGYDPDPLEIIGAMSDRTKLVLLTSPHNPSGHSVTDDTLRRVHDACAERGAWLFVDEVYGEFRAGPLRSARRIGERTLAASSFTKRWGMGWARAGWLHGARDLLEGRIMPAIRHSTGQTGSHHTAIGVAALDRASVLDDRADRAVGDGASRVDAWVQKHGALSWLKPPAGLHGYVRIAGDVHVRPRVEAAAQTHGLIVAPGEFFGADRSAFRIGWTADETVLDEALPILAEVLEL